MLIEESDDIMSKRGGGNKEKSHWLVTFFVARDLWLATRRPCGLEPRWSVEAFRGMRSGTLRIHTYACGQSGLTAEVAEYAECVTPEPYYPL